MDAETILKLVNAGFTKEDIMGLGNVQAQTPTQAEPAEEPEPVPVLEVAEEPVAVATPTPQPTPAPTPVPEQAQPSMTDVMREIARLTSAVQANAIANSSLPVQTGVNVDNVMASIIKPTRGSQNG